MENSDPKFKRVAKTLAGGGGGTAPRRGSGGQTHAPRPPPLRVRKTPTTSEAARACARGEGERAGERRRRPSLAPQRLSISGGQESE